ncbi:MAG: YceI family protein [Bacteroidota bacterium]|nr:YceI family protein [Bacteroidota bacterium]MDP4191475.1 YceI family protein [Bacteroidota bacterium]MDP4195890.1 YceI family protein [Bacteroidota bacterium]
MLNSVNSSIADETKTATWALDPAHSRVQFSAKHMIISTVKGNFNSYGVNVHTEGDNFETADIEVIIDTSSIDTGAPDRDNHLRSDDFFNAEKYPQMKFKSTKLEKLDDESYKLYGDLTIRDITKPIELEVEYGGTVIDPWGNTRVGFSVNGSLDRFEYGLKWNALIETGGAVVGKTIKLSADIELIKQK